MFDYVGKKLPHRLLILRRFSLPRIIPETDYEVSFNYDGGIQSYDRCTKTMPLVHLVHLLLGLTRALQ